ncbi:protein disks lost [Scaptodrosophila lebanonensis]|uniref:Protein disks lost n=1 Tax=Drosophila lebanonensis TaxID=7225 RepID=A0A6J2TVF7_DROLE|nr:protein disks lost [Scaptodrosophila lebanonensis]
MSTIEEQELQQLLKDLENVPTPQLRQRLLNHFQKQDEPSCTLEDFAIYYLAGLRQCTEAHFRSSEEETPKCQTPVKQMKAVITTTPKVTVQSNRKLITPESSNTCNLTNESQHSLNSSCNTSTTSSAYQSNPSTPACGTPNPPNHGRRSQSHFCSTPQNSERSNRSGGGNSSFCLGDFIVNTPNQRSKKKATPQHQSPGTTPQETSNAETVNKPRRRVLPMTISKNVSGSSFGEVPLGIGTSSFSNDYNLWRLSQSTELVDRSQSAALDMEARKTLLLHKQEIKIEAHIATDRLQNLALATQEQEESESIAELTVDPIDLTDLPNSAQLQLLAGIYAQLMDLNLIPNVLSELCFTLQLLNIREGVSNSFSQEPESPLAILCQYKNCIYFAAKVLELQQSLLLQLDRKSLAMVLQNERLLLLPKSQHEELNLACQQKQLEQQQQLIVSGDTGGVKNSKLNVYYQHDKDSRDNFPTQSEFSAFKSQRDLFYKAFKYWELNHLNRIFKFSSEVAPKIRDIFKQSEHVVNMAHFAKLFVSQLLISASEATESPEELGLKLDQLRLNRLAQRLVTSSSSVEDQFPRTQAFFCDFINECGSISFLVQLKLALYAQLMRYNNSTFELVQLNFDSGEIDVLGEPDESSEQVQGPYIVRVSTMASMLILAKFLGYVTALPYNRQNPATVLNTTTTTASNCSDLQQLQLRSNFQPDFNLSSVLERAMGEGKLLVTLPWLVQYVIMLDVITIQLPNNKATMELLYTVYAEAANQRCLQPTAEFVIRTCIGWLLESHATLTNNYYSYRRQWSRARKTNPLVLQCLEILHIKVKSSTCQQGGASNSNLSSKNGAPLLEYLLPVSCPFLPEFRVAITPSKQVQSTSRTGRFRYITTRLEQFNSVKSPVPEESQASERDNNKITLSLVEPQQSKLIDAFLHSQNASMRRLLEFVTERSFKCVVKDAQQQILLPSKAQADGQVNAIRSTQQMEVYRDVKRIYSEACHKACDQWQEQVPAMLERRIQKSLNSLLPSNTSDVLQRTYAKLIRAQAQPQLQQWLQSNVLQSNFYYSDLQEVAIKVCRANKNNTGSMPSNSNSSTELCLSGDGNISLSDFLYHLQTWLHCLSLRPKCLAGCVDILDLLRNAHQAVLQSQLPTVFYYLVGSGLVRLLQLFIVRRPQLLTPTFMSMACDVWRAPQLKKLIHRPETKAEQQGNPGIFDALLSVSFVQELSMAHPSSFQLLQELLLAMLTTGVLHIELLNEFFLPLFKEEWAPPIWNALSQLLQQVAQYRVAGGDGIGETPTAIPASAEEEAKSHLFMEALADLSRDVDF